MKVASWVPVDFAVPAVLPGGFRPRCTGERQAIRERWSGLAGDDPDLVTVVSTDIAEDLSPIFLSAIGAEVPCGLPKKLDGDFRQR